MIQIDSNRRNYLGRFSWPFQSVYFVFQQLDQLWRGRKTTSTLVPSICIGNFQAGGTGKTPMVQWTAKALSSAGYSPVIVSRGYRGELNKVATLVHTEHTAKAVGDEAKFHSEFFPVVIGKDRIKACTLAAQYCALQKLNKPILVLDDGLQHYPLHIDFKVVCTKSSSPFWMDTLLPTGRLRQVPHSKCDAIVVLGNAIPNGYSMETDLFHFKLKIKLIRGTRLPGLLVSGLANNDEFSDYLKNEIELSRVDMLSYKDHYNYSSKDLKIMEKRSASYNYHVHCTTKDVSKIEALISQSNSPIILSVWDTEPVSSDDNFTLLEAMVERIEYVSHNRLKKSSRKA